jgi:hypothetical protein
MSAKNPQINTNVDTVAESAISPSTSSSLASSLKKQLGTLIGSKASLSGSKSDLGPISPSFQDKKAFNVDALKGNIQISSKAALSPLFDALFESSSTFAYVNKLRITSQIPFIKVKEIILKEAVVGLPIPPRIHLLGNLTVM